MSVRRGWEVEAAEFLPGRHRGLTNVSRVQFTILALFVLNPCLQPTELPLEPTWTFHFQENELWLQEPEKVSDTNTTVALRSRAGYVQGTFPFPIATGKCPTIVAVLE